MARKTNGPDDTSVVTTKRGRKAKVIDDAATGEPIAAASTPTEPRAPKAKKCPTLADTFAGYLRSLEDAGKSDGTIFSYRLELATAGAELGIDTKLADLTAERVLAFFTSDRVTKTRSGRAKSPSQLRRRSGSCGRRSRGRSARGWSRRHPSRR